MMPLSSDSAKAERHWLPSWQNGSWTLRSGAFGKDVWRDMYQYRLHSHKNIGACGKACGQRRFLEVKKAYYRQSIARKEEVVSFLRQKNYHNLADNPHITVYTGIGSFAGPDVVEVGMVEGTLQLQAPRIFINTGAETVIPPIEGIQGNPRVYTSTLHYGTD